MNADKPGFKYKEQEATAKFAYCVIPAKAGIQNSLNRAPKKRDWIPGRASLARNDNLPLFSRVLHEPH